MMVRVPQIARHPARLLGGLILAAGLALASPAEAQNIGVVDVQRILEESSAGRIARDLLRQTTRRAEARIEGLKKEFEGLQQRYESQRALLKPDAREALERELLEKQMTLRQELQRTQMDLQGRDAELTGSILDELKPIIERLAAERKLDLVVERGEAGILFMAPKLDLTDLVLRRYDASKQADRKD